MLDTLTRPFLKRASTPSTDFDFLMGIWRCHHRYRVRRLSGCNDWIEFDGTCAARKILAGRGNSDESDIGMPGGRYTGMSLRLWDAERERWTIHWLDSRTPGRIGSPVRGGFRPRADGPFGVFYGDDELDGRAIRVRTIWSRIATEEPRWEQAFSLDEGNDWETNWTMDFTRV
ncbi:hypothetical protein BH10PSE6_BH10PSE6_50860 [soil metagenome]